MGEVMHYGVVVAILLGLFNHLDAEDALLLHGGLHHFELVTKRTRMA